MSPDNTPEEKVLHILQNLHGVSPDVREAAIQELCSLDKSTVIPQLITLLANPDPGTRGDAAEALLILDANATQRYVLPLLKDPVRYIRWNVVDWILDYGNSAATDELVDVLLHDDDSDNRYMAAIALGKIGNAQAVSALEWAEAHDSGLDYEEDTVRRAATIALARLRKRLEQHGSNA